METHLSFHIYMYICKGYDQIIRFLIALSSITSFLVLNNPQYGWRSGIGRVEIGMITSVHFFSMILCNVLCNVLTSGGLPGETIKGPPPPLYFAADDFVYGGRRGEGMG